MATLPHTTDEVNTKSLQFYSPSDLCNLLRVSKRTIQRWIGAGHFPEPDLRIGQTWRWKHATVQRFVDELAGEQPEDVELGLIDVEEPSR